MKPEDLQIVFKYKHKGTRKWLVGNPVTLANILEEYSQTQIDFDDGTYLQLEDFYWGVAKVEIEVITPTHLSEQG